MRDDSLSDRFYWKLGAAGSEPYDRPFEEYASCLDLDLSSDGHLAQGKVVMDLGAGHTRKFAREAKKLGHKARIVSVDPRAGAPELNPNLIEPAGEDEWVIASFAQELGVADESVDLVAAMYSFPMYADADSENKGWQEILRVLKPGGEARIYPVDSLKAQKLKEALPNVEIETRPIHSAKAAITAWLLVLKKPQA